MFQEIDKVQNKLVPLGIAIELAVREMIKLSDNLPLEFNEETEKFIKELEKKLAQQRGDRAERKLDLNPNLYDKEEAQIILKSGIGDCGELVRVCRLLAELIDLSKLGLDALKPIYLSRVLIVNGDGTNHEMCLMHKSESIASIKDKTFVGENLEKFFELYKDELDSALFIDPWTYQVVECKHYSELQGNAQSFGVDGYYEGGVGIVGHSYNISNGFREFQCYEESVLYNYFINFYNALITDQLPLQIQKGKQLIEEVKKIYESLEKVNAQLCR